MNRTAALVLFFSLFLLAGVSFFASQGLSIEDEDEQYPTIGKEKGLEDILEDVIPTLVRKKIGNLRVDISGSAVGGYDANVNLDRYDEDSSLFMQNTFGIYGTYPIKNSIFTLRGGYDFILIKYFKFSDPDLLDNILSTGIDAKLTDDLVWSVDYLADFVGFPHDELSEYTLNQIGTSLRHEITDWLYQKIGYEFFYKHYPKLKTRNNRGTLRLGDREDWRNAVFHQLGIYLGERIFIKTVNKVYNNDSNENFLDYYDYNALKSKVTVTHLITNKLYETVSFGYQYKAYRKRGVSDSDEDQRDHLFIYGGSIFYDVLPSVSVGASFDYRKNYSNENTQRYEDIIVSSGVYCFF